MGSSEHANTAIAPEEILVAELFAGAGGFRLALEGCAVPGRPSGACPSAERALLRGLVS